MPPRGMTRRVEAQPGLPLPHGLLNAATKVPVTDSHELMGVHWPVLGCTEAHTWDWCPPDESPGDESPGDLVKQFDRARWAEGPSITIYSGAECSAIGMSQTEAEQRATNTLVMGEQRALEEWTLFNLLSPEAVDITPASGPVAIPQSVGLLEGWLASNYGGLGVLHVPAALSSMLAQAGQIIRDGARMRTWLGNLLALGAGYAANIGPNGQPAPAGHAWLYGSGPVTVRFEPMNNVPDDEAASINMRTNDRQVLAERTYVVQLSCVAAILVSISCCC